MRLKVNRTPRSKRDTIHIWDYIANDSPKAAEKMLRRIDQVIQMLSERPQNGRASDELGTGIRTFPIESYLVFYRHSDTTLTIIRILHAARNITTDLLAD